MFYWAEKVSQTSFVPHELGEVPLKRGPATVKIKLDQIKQRQVAPSADGTAPIVSITLRDGKTGEFALGILGSFKGRFRVWRRGVAAVELKQVVFH